MKGDRNTPVVQERLIQLEALIRQGNSHKVIEFTLAKQWNLTTRQIRNYIKEVYDEWARQRQAGPRDDAELVRNGFLDIVRRALDQVPPDLHAATRAYAHIGRMGGLFSDKVQVTGAEGGPLQVSIEDARKAVAERIAAALKKPKAE